MKNIVFPLAISATFATLTAACSDDFDAPKPASQSDQICFEASFEPIQDGGRADGDAALYDYNKLDTEIHGADSSTPVYLHSAQQPWEVDPSDIVQAGDSSDAGSRSTLHTVSDLDTDWYMRMGMSGIAFEGDYFIPGQTEAKGIFHNIEIGMDEIFLPYFWPEDYTSQFFSVSPAVSEHYDMEFTTASDGYHWTDFYLSYHPVNSSDNNLTDFYVAKSDPVSPYDQPKMAFLRLSHGLTALKLNLDLQDATSQIANGRIVKVKLFNIYTSGNYNFAEDEWKFDGYEPTNLTIDFANSPLSGGHGSIDGDLTLLVVPQKLRTGSCIEITVQSQDNKSYARYAAMLKDMEWHRNTILNYTLSTSDALNDYKLQVNWPNRTVRGDGTASYTATIAESYKQSSTGKLRVPLDVTSEAYQWNYNTGTWTKTTTSWLKYEGAYNSIDYNTTSSDNFASGKFGAMLASQKLKINVDPLPLSSIYSPVGRELATVPPKGTADNPWNLSNAAGLPEVENTANCYIVNGPGVYSIPCVYGNAIKDGQDNWQAYSGIDGCVNGLNEAITSPYITTLRSANAVMTDTENLITDVKLDADNNRIVFTVNANTIHEGNAQIMLHTGSKTLIYSSGGNASACTLWLWNIWVTPYNPDQDDVEFTRNGVTTTFMAKNLGHAADRYNVYDERKSKVVFKQAESLLTRELEVTQEGYEELDAASSVLYQWGRLTYVLGISSIGQKYRKNYSTEYPFYGHNSPSMSAQWLVSLPNYFLLNSYTGYNTHWIKKVSSTEIYKTVFDPCPVGYRLPRQSELNALATSSSTWNGTGRTFTDDNGNQLTLDAHGRITSSGTTGLKDSEGYYWSSECGSSYPYLLKFGSTGNPTLTSSSSNPKNMACSIRPVRE